MNQMTAIAIGTDPRDGQQILLLSDSEEKTIIPMSITLDDAQSINLALSHINTVKPLTHQLLLNLASELDRSFARVDIDVSGDGSFFATIKIRKNGFPDNVISLVSNPADAIVVAIRAKVPIFISDAVLATNIKQTQNDQQVDSDKQQFKQFVENVKASDFKIEGLSSHQ